MKQMSTSNRTITVVGGGSSAHSLIPLLSQSGATIQLLTSQPEAWSLTPTLKMVTNQTDAPQVIEGRIDRISSDYASLVPHSDLIILCMPVCKYNDALKQIAKYTRSDRTVFIGTMYGQGGFNWMVNSAYAGNQPQNILTFAIGLLPWICRTETYGHVGLNFGCKTRNVVALSNRSQFDQLNKAFLNEICARWFGKGEFFVSDNFLSLTLSVDNQIIHPSRCYALFKQYDGAWSTQEEIPYFYKDYDEYSAQQLAEIDAEYSLIRNAIVRAFPEAHFKYMFDYLALERFSYNTCNTDIQKSFSESPTLGTIKPPIVKDRDLFKIDTSHRFFLDDIEYGLCIAKWFAEKLDISTPRIDSIITWAKSASSSIQSVGNGTPDRYGILELADAIS